MNEVAGTASICYFSFYTQILDWNITEGVKSVVATFNKLISHFYMVCASFTHFSGRSKQGSLDKKSKQAATSGPQSKLTYENR